MPIDHLNIKKFAYAPGFSQVKNEPVVKVLLASELKDQTQKLINSLQLDASIHFLDVKIGKNTLFLKNESRVWKEVELNDAQKATTRKIHKIVNRQIGASIDEEKRGKQQTTLLQNEVKALSTQVENLSNSLSAQKVADLTQENQNLKEKLQQKKLKARHEELCNKLDNINDTLKRLSHIPHRSQNDEGSSTAQTRIHDLEKELEKEKAESNRRNTEFEDIIRKNKDKVDETKEDYLSEQAKNQRLQKNLNDSTTTILDLNHKNEELKRAIEENEKRYKEASSRNSDTENRIRELLNKNTNLLKQIHEKDEEYNKFKTQLDENKINQVKVNNLEAQLTRAQLDSNELKQKHQKEIEQITQELKKSQNHLMTLGEEFEKLKKLLADANKKIEALEANKITAETTEKNSLSTIAGQEDEIARLKSQIENLEKASKSGLDPSVLKDIDDLIEGIFKGVNAGKLKGRSTRGKLKAIHKRYFDMVNQILELKNKNLSQAKTLKEHKLPEYKAIDYLNLNQTDGGKKG